MHATLQKMGLSKNESAVYLALLDAGLSSAKPLIEKTKLHRQLVYDALDGLIEKGLVSYVLQAQWRYYRAADPRQFNDYYTKKEQKLRREQNTFNQLLPQLLKKQQATMEVQEVTVYKGKKGIKTLLDDILREGKALHSIGTSDIQAEAFSYHLRFNLPQFHKERERKRVPFKVLLSEDMKSRAKMFSKMKHSQARVLPKAFTSNASTNIYGDKVSIMMWGSQPFGILIKSEEVARAQKKHFTLLWKLGKKP